MSRRTLPAILAVLMIVTLGPLLGLADEADFERTWARTDKPVADGRVSRTWMWGPESFTDIITEEYAEAPDGSRAVQYFDKARMEITDPAADAGSIWYVTNGLLVVELMSGELQLGNDTFEQREPAEINVAGDADDPSGPTYATFVPLLDVEPAAVGEAITRRVDLSGQVTQDATLAERGITATHLDEVTNHAIAQPFWDFMTSSGIVWEDGQLTEAALFEDPLFATGRPVTEAYWANVKVANIYRDVLLQCFERRCLTYTPDNPQGWQVEAGNVGRHYYEWRYEQADPGPAGIYITSVQGVETAAGDIDGDTRFGATFVGSASGDVPGAFHAEINYTPPNPGAGVTNTIVGGTWSISGDIGAVTGVFSSGSAVWDEAGEQARISTIMKVTGRSGSFDSLPREARFNGTLSHTVFPPRISGTLTLYR